MVKLSNSYRHLPTVYDHHHSHGSSTMPHCYSHPPCPPTMARAHLFWCPLEDSAVWRHPSSETTFPTPQPLFIWEAKLYTQTQHTNTTHTHTPHSYAHANEEDLPCKSPMDSWSVFRFPTYSATYVLRNHAASRSSIVAHWSVSTSLPGSCSYRYIA